MSFIKVTAFQCNSQGSVTQDTKRRGRVELFINSDLIAGIRPPTVGLKVGTIVKLGNDYFTDIHIHRDVDISQL